MTIKAECLANQKASKQDNACGANKESQEDNYPKSNRVPCICLEFCDQEQTKEYEKQKGNIRKDLIKEFYEGWVESKHGYEEQALDPREAVTRHKIKAN